MAELCCLKCCLYEQKRLSGEVHIKSKRIANLVRHEVHKVEEDESDDSDKVEEEVLNGKQGKEDDTEKNQGVVLLNCKAARISFK